MTQSAAQKMIARTLLQKFDVPRGSYETVVEFAEFAPDAVVERHTHPGIEAGYVLAGDLTLQVDGRAAQVLKAGQSYQLPAGVAHVGHVGAAGGSAVFVWVVEKDKPLR